MIRKLYFRTDFTHDIWQFGIVIFICLTGESKELCNIAHMGWLDEKGFGRKMRNESAFEACDLPDSHELAELSKMIL